MQSAIPKNFAYTGFIYDDHLTPKGYLPREERVRASACWHFCRLAIQAIHKVPAQVVEEGETDRTIRLTNILESVMIQYEIHDAGDILCFASFCKAEAIRCAYPWPSRLDAWLASGGKAWNVVTREPEALNKA